MITTHLRVKSLELPLLLAAAGLQLRASAMRSWKSLAIRNLKKKNNAQQGSTDRSGREVSDCELVRERAR